MKIFINRPTAVLTGLILVLIICVGQFKNVPITLLPVIERNFIRLVIEYPSHSPEDILRQLQPLITQLESVSGVENIEFSIRETRTMIILQFPFGGDREGLLQEINVRLDISQSALPAFMKRPFIPSEAVEKLFEMKLVVEGGQSPLEISGFVKQSLIPRIKQIQGVSFIDVSGIKTDQVQLIIDPIKMASWGIKVEDLSKLLHQEQINIQTLSLSAGRYTYLLVPEVDTVPIGEIFLVGNIRVKDVAIINDSNDISEGVHYFNGNRAIVLRIFTNNKARLSSLRKNLQSLIKDLQTRENIIITVIQDQTKILFSGIDNLAYSISIGGAITFLLFMVFMGDYRLPLIVGFIIPLSIIITIGLFSVFNITINIISLSGITLGLGLLVDNAIILLENIVRYHSKGMCSREACIQGFRDIFGPLLGSNLTTLGIFLPLLIGGGVVGVIFKEEAIVISIIITCSLFLSFILLPVIYHLTFSSQCPNSEGFLYKRLCRRFHVWAGWSFKNQKTTLLIFIVFALLGTFSGFHIPVTYLPAYENQERMLLFSNKVNLNYPSFKFTGHTSELIVGKSGNFLNPDTAPYTLIITGPMVKEIADSLKYVYHDEVVVFPTPTFFSSIFGSDEPEVIIKVYSNKPPFKPKHEIAEANYLREPYYNQHVLRLLHLNSRDIDEQYSSLINQTSVKTSLTFLSGGAPVFTGVTDRQIFFNELAFITNSEVHNNIEGDTKGRYSSYVYNLKDFNIKGPGFLRMLDKRDIPYTISGSYHRGKKIQRDLFLMGLTAVFLLFMILVIQFESFVWPLVVMSVIPVGIAGSLGALYLTGQSLNVMSGIGMVAMLGIVVNDAILKVSAIRKCDSCWPISQILMEAHSIRLKPILMTTGTTVLSCLPMLFFTGIGNELHRALVIAILGGLTSATFAAIFLIPSIVQQRKN
jgi:multidrug efflux pump subunit AcrB